MKVLGIILLVLFIFIFVFSFAKNMIVKAAIENGVELVTGLTLRMGSLDIGIIKTLVGIKGIVLFNPKGYKDRIMMDMPEAYVDYDLPAIIKGDVHLEEVRIDVKEFTVVKNEEGDLNIDSLKAVRAQKEGKGPKEKDKKKLPPMQIDNLKLKIRKVIYKDYSKGEPPVIKEYRVDIDEQYSNITNPYALVSMIVVRALVNTTISDLAGFDLEGLQHNVSNTLAKAQEALKQTSGKAQETVKQTTEVIKETAESLKKILSPFGKEE